MILILDEFDGAHYATELDNEVIQAINDGEYTAYRFGKDSEKIQQYDGENWIDIAKWPS
jgi:hypothetical protein